MVSSVFNSLIGMRMPSPCFMLYTESVGVGESQGNILYSVVHLPVHVGERLIQWHDVISRCDPDCSSDNRVITKDLSYYTLKIRKGVQFFHGWRFG